jgi:hypothetical protein
VNRKRLQAVLRVRTLQERGARGELARRTQAHHRAQAAEERTWELLQAVQATSGDPLGLQTAVAVRDAGTRAVERQHDTTEAAREGVIGARDEWTIAARRVEALERLGERLRDADEAEAERLQILEVDDLVLARRGRGPAPDGSAA